MDLESCLGISNTKSLGIVLLCWFWAVPSSEFGVMSNTSAGTKINAISSTHLGQCGNGLAMVTAPTGPCKAMKSLLTQQPCYTMLCMHKCFFWGHLLAQQRCTLTCHCARPSQCGENRCNVDSHWPTTWFTGLLAGNLGGGKTLKQHGISWDISNIISKISISNPILEISMVIQGFQCFQHHPRAGIWESGVEVKNMTTTSHHCRCDAASKRHYINQKVSHLEHLLLISGCSIRISHQTTPSEWCIPSESYHF